MVRRPPLDSIPSPGALAASIAVDVRTRRGVPRSALPKVPPAARAALEDALRAEGLEVTRSAVRLPARAQLLALLDSDRTVEEKGLATRLAFVTAPETNALVARLVLDAEVLRIERPTGPALARPSERTLGADRAKLLVSELERTLKWIRRATRSSRGDPARLLERDVSEILGRFRASSPDLAPTPIASRVDRAAQSADAPSGSLLSRLARAASQLAAQHGGLAPVAKLVRGIDAPTAKVHAALLEGHARGWFELQPESSMGRLGAEDLALCLPGPEGTRLSWVRPLAIPPDAEGGSAQSAARSTPGAEARPRSKDVLP